MAGFYVRLELKKYFSINLWKVGSEAVWVFGGQVGVALGGLLSVKILTHLLSPYEYGRFSIANTVIVLISANLFGPLGQGMMRHWSIVQDRRALTSFYARNQEISSAGCFVFRVAGLSFWFCPDGHSQTDLDCHYRLGPIQWVFFGMDKRSLIYTHG